MPSTKNLLLANIEGLNHDDGNFVEVTKSHQPIWDVGIWWKNYFFYFSALIICLFEVLMITPEWKTLPYTYFCTMSSKL